MEQFLFLTASILSLSTILWHLTNHYYVCLFSTTLRVTRAATLQGQDGGSTRNAGYVGKTGKDFEFSHVLPVTVEFTECSAKGQADGEADLSAVEKWLEKIA